MWRGALLGAAIWAASAPAGNACIGSNYYHGIIFDEAPEDAPSEALILDVSFENVPESWFMTGAVVKARVRNVVRGEYRSDFVRVGIGGSSCDAPFVFGTEGLIVGTIETGHQPYKLTLVHDGRASTQIALFGHEGTWFSPISETVVDRIRRSGVVGDFDGDGSEDRAAFRVVGDDIIIEVTLASAPMQPIEIWRAPADQAESFQLSVAASGDYTTACARYWRCDPEERSNVSLRHDAIMLTAWEGPADFLYFWNGEAFESELIRE